MPALNFSAAQPLILASASPRRAELLTAVGIPFTVMVSPAPEPEKKPPIIPIDLWPACLAFIKAQAVQKQMAPHRGTGPEPLVLGADTIVVDDDRILNKARDRRHARQMLLSLSGKSHRVITGICLLSGTSVRLSRATATCKFKKLTPAVLNAYLDSGLWRGKAGAYGIQDDVPSPFVSLSTGDLSTVIGLPLPLLQRELASLFTI